MAASVQEAIALGVAALAALYVIKRLTGWPRRRPPNPPNVVKPQGRLARGLERARRARRNG